ncbi:hypothetical protein D2T31_04980 [Sinirhodobacter populi]|uniref:Gene transfer agent family protein n=1 Tax=Paenirhodobacter populi TaxID=2306993 RepID=A0A443KF70_9RHOB|nr:hypothetical protein [Sinirhodobacter populi]RWR31355.1 hypothetical protein D2T31_04980 [Sinirhodobacter populi]
MAEFTGEFSHTVGGKTYRLALGLRGIAVLQQELGKDLAPLQIEDGDHADFNVLLRVVEVALQRHHPDAGPEVAEEILASDLSIWARLVAAAFPDAPEGTDTAKGGRTGKPKARR